MSVVSDLELQKMIRGFRVSDLQALLIFAGRNKGGKKTELQARALDLIKLRSQPIDMKIRELHRNRYQQTHGSTSDPPDLFSPEIYPQGLSDPMGSNYSNMSSHKSTMLSSGIPNYISSLNHHSLLRSSAVPPLPQYPVNPDVKFKDLPFYDVLNDLLKPTSLVPTRDIVQEKELIFYLCPQDLKELDSNTNVQVQFRIGCLEINKEQEDDLPTSVCLKVNKLVATLPNPLPNNKPGTEPKRPKRPIDISSYIKHSTTEPQTVCVSWATSNKPLITGVFLVRKQTSDVLIKRLKDIGVRNPDHTTAMIKDLLYRDENSEIASMSLRSSLLCPLSKMRMSLPCRALSCSHLQCFDAAAYIRMNEKKPKWVCPVCDKPAVFKQLAIDGLFLDITTKAPADCNEIQFHENCSWTPVIPVVNKKVPEITEATIQVPKVDNPKPKKQKVEIVDLDSGSDTDTQDSWPIQPPKKKPFKPSGLSVLLQNSSAELAAKSYMYEASSSKSAPSSSKSSAVSEEKSLSSQIATNFSCLSTSKNFESSESSSPAFSPESPDPQPSASTTFQETIDILNNPSSTAGQCYDFDLYSFMQQNNEDVFKYQGNSAEDSLPEETHDIISID